MARSDVRIRPMRWWDIAAVTDLEQQVFSTDQWSAEQFWSELAQPTRSYVVVEDVSGEHAFIVGYAGIFVLGAESDVQTIAIAPATQGARLGSLLMDHLIAMARARGATQMMLEVRSDNDRAISLYQRLGFERISTRRDYYAPGVDANVMRLRPLPVGAAPEQPAANRGEG